MTDPRTIRRRAHALTILVGHLGHRVPPTLGALVALGSDGFPSRASGAAADGGRGHAELTPTEAAAHRNLGDLEGVERYRPGPSTSLADLDELLAGAVDLVTRALDVCDRYGTASQVDTSRLRCAGTYDATCRQHADPSRRDGQCIDCGRSADTEARRLRRYREGAA